MTASLDNPECLIVLVGSNPLPNFLVACALRPAELALVYTDETAAAKDRLKSELRQSLGGSVRFVEPDPFVDDATCATTVRRAIDPLLAPGARTGDTRGHVWLNYTGGTKVMAAHARVAFVEHGGPAACASYLDEGGNGVGPRLRFDDGRSRSLADFDGVGLDLRTVLALHGIQHKLRSAPDGGPTANDARRILCAVLGDVGLAKRLYNERLRLAESKKPTTAFSAPFLPGNHGIDLSIQSLPVSSEMNRKAYEHWYQFIGGEWLEEWVGAQIGRLELTPSPEIVVGVNAFRGDARANLEVDVAAIRGQRSYFISCTTDTTKPICKSKLFEVAVRSRQLGGDLARAALVCLANDDTVTRLRQDIDELWGASNTTRVFGLSDVRTWSDCAGKQATRHSLRTWMES